MHNSWSPKIRTLAVGSGKKAQLMLPKEGHYAQAQLRCFGVCSVVRMSVCLHVCIVRHTYIQG